MPITEKSKHLDQLGLRQKITELEIDTGTKTATASAGAVTLNKTSGVITTEALSTAAGDTPYTLTITNSEIAAADIVQVTIGNGTNSAGLPFLSSAVPAAGSVVLRIFNKHASAALNGTLKVMFVVIKG